MNPRSTPRHLVIDAPPPGTASIDVRFDGIRIWSIDVRERSSARGRQMDFIWPEPLRPHLSGRTRLSIADSQSGEELSAGEVEFDRAEHRTRVADPSGAPLAINKWGRLGVALETMGADTRRLIVERSELIVEQLGALGLRPFVVGGTLLGAVREGTLLPHDDDADIAYLSEHTNPVDVAAEAFRVGRELEALGYEVKRHSAAHMQLLFRDGTGSVRYYIDVFAAFFTSDGMINQPFHVRGEMRRDQMLPFSTVSIDGASFPAPHDPNRWLSINYDRNWRTPIPGFVLETPLDTRRRFENWFGAFNFQRDFWDDFHARPTDDQAELTAKTESQWGHGRDWLAERASERSARSLSAPSLIELGCGGGALTRRIAAERPDQRVLGLDYSGEAIQRARDTDSPCNAEYGRINLYRARSLSIPLQHGIDGPFDLVANHVLEEIGHHGRSYVWRLIRMALRSGGSAHVTFHERPAARVSFDDPTGWHLDPEALAAEAAGFGLEVVCESLAEEEHTAPLQIPLGLARAEARRRHSRRPTGAAVHLAGDLERLSDRRGASHE